jgi:tetratricopeptide (TPR) repeat protein
MALKKCKECGKEISSKASSCPNCGAPVKKQKSKIGCLGTVVLVVVGLAIIGHVSKSCEDRSKQTEARKKAIEAEQKAKEVAEQKAELAKRNLDFFEKNKSTIIGEITDYYNKGDYQKVVSEAKKYTKSDDPELKEIYGKAKSILDEVNRKKREKEILATLKKVPAFQFEKNKNFYHQLLQLYPDNSEYKKKYEFYTAKLEEQRKKESIAAERKKKIEMQFSPWDGSHRNLEKYIKKIMNDPKSYDHVETVYWDRGNYLIVKTTFRGKNAFGGVVINSIKARVDTNGNILQIME